MSIKKWFEKNTHSLCGKRIAVTGSTGGLGVELCDYLATLGAELILLDRNATRSAEHREKLAAKHAVKVSSIILDLEDITSADSAVDKLIELDIDVFIHNAGAYSIPRRVCSTGYNNVYQINFVTPYYMIRRLMPHLSSKKGRVVAVGSIAHDYSKTDINDVDFSERTAASKLYGNAKRHLMYGLQELFRDEQDATLSITHPGITFTNITAHYPPLVFAIIKYPMKIVFMKPKKAALSVLSGLFHNTEYPSWIGPWMFDVWGLPKKKKLNTATDTEIESIAKIADCVYNRCIECIGK